MEPTLNAIAASQYGLITRAQVLASGGSARVVELRLSRGDWVRRYRGVYALASHPLSFRQAALGACFAGRGEGAISHIAACRLHGMSGFRRPEIDLTTRRHVRIPGVTVHRARLDPDEIVEAHRIPVTSLQRTLVDVALLLPTDRLEEALDEVIARGVPISRLLRYLKDGGGRYRAGAVILRRMLGDGGGPRSETVHERRLYRLLARGGVEGIVRQHRIYEGEERIARVDIAIPHVRIAIEADGRRTHFGLRRWIADTDRATRIGSQAWFVLRFTWWDVEERPDWVVDEVNKAVAAADLAMKIGATERT